MDATTLYWITRLDGIASMSATFTGIGGSLLAVACICLVICNDYPRDAEGVETSKKALKIIAPFFLFGLLSYVFVPTTKEMAAILVIPAIAESEDVQEIGSELVELSKAWIEELKPNEE